MKLTRATGTLGLAALAAIVSPLALAAEPGWYIGGNVGQSRSNIDDERITSTLLGAGLVVQNIDDDDRDVGFKLFGGYQLNKNLALEGGYFDLGKFGFVATTLPAGTLTGQIKLKGLNFDLLGTLPLSEKFSAFARLGLIYTEAKDTFVGSGAVAVNDPNPRKRSAGPKFGLGVQYDFTKALGMRFEGERYRVKDAVGSTGDIDLLSLGLVYRFGTKADAPPPPAPAPEPAPVAAAPEPQSTVIIVAVVAPPPEPAPKAAVAPAPAKPGKVEFSADSFFDFDKSSLKLAGKTELDKFAEELKVTEYDVITVTGHTDRFGKHAYNMKLSKARADVVKAYLVEHGGVPARRINSLGVNGSDPVTRPDECKGKKSPAVLACLQADRRVVVDVVGTQALE
jgi:OOP family OmpA-OmpF porin